MIKESSWQGRMGGLDSSTELESKTSIRIRRKVSMKRDLPPIGVDAEGSMVRTSKHTSATCIAHPMKTCM